MPSPKRFKPADITGDLFGQNNPVVPSKPTPLAKLPTPKQKPKPKPKPEPKLNRLLTRGEKFLHKKLFGTTPLESKTLNELKRQIAEYRNRGNTRGL
jgi:hypothetical protein